MNDKILSLVEVCQYLGMSKNTLYFFTSSKQIPHYKAGKLLRFRQSDIDKWLESKRVKVVAV